MQIVQDTPRVNNSKKERLTRKQRARNGGAWYIDKAKFYEQESMSNRLGYGNIDEYKRMKTNYDLFNNILNVDDLAYVCKPFGEDIGELTTASMVNRDIVSYRIKALLGMEQKKKFGARVIAVNPEATTRKEEEKTNRIRQYVIDSIMAPIQADIQAKYQEQLQGKQLSAQDKEAIQKQIQEEIEQSTPERIRNYMKRKHQDPSEIQGQQILNYLTREQSLDFKFQKGWKHANLSAYEIYYVGIVNGKPVLWNVNPMRFSCDMSPDSDFVEEGQWAVCEYRMSPSQAVRMFDLSNSEIDSIYDEYRHRVSMYSDEAFFEDSPTLDDDTGSHIIVKHFVFRTLRKMGYLKYQEEEGGQVHERMLVDEEYVLNPEIGDISIEWEWVDDVCEIWKVGADIYKNYGPVEGTIVDENNYKNPPLPYCGGVYDKDNSLPTCPMDRMKVYQYYFNIIFYKVEQLMASDEGKKILMNIGIVPKKAGIDLKQWQYFFKTTPFAWFNPKEPGMDNQDVNSIAKVIDMSLISDISKYIELAGYMEQACGKAIGVTDPVLGQTAVSERVTNNQQNLVQTSYIMEPYFAMHNKIKHNVLQRLLDTARVAYLNTENEIFLTNVLDDMSTELLKVDKDLLANNTLGLFIEDNATVQEIKDSIASYVQAALQNQKVELSEVFKILRHESITEASQELEVAEEKRQARETDEAQKDRDAQADLQKRVEEENKLQHERAKELVVIKEQEKRKTDIQKQTILTVGFNEDKDMDGDGKIDALEVASQGVNAQIQIDEQRRKDRELAHTIDKDNKEIEIKRTVAEKKTTAK